MRLFVLFLLTAPFLTGCDPCATFGMGGYNDQDVVLTQPLPDTGASVGESFSVDFSRYWRYEAGDECTAPYKSTPPIMWAESSSSDVELRFESHTLVATPLREVENVEIRVFGREEGYSTSPYPNYSRSPSPASFRLSTGKELSPDYAPSPTKISGRRVLRVLHSPSVFTGGDTLTLHADVIDTATGEPPRRYGFSPLQLVWGVDDSKVYWREGGHSGPLGYLPGFSVAPDSIRVLVREDTDEVMGVVHADTYLGSEALAFHIVSE